MSSLDPAIAHLLETIRQLPGPQYWELSATEARKITDDPQVVEQFNGTPEPIFDIKNVRIPVHRGEIKLRIYSPHDLAENKPLPLLLYLHGGGWVLGSSDVYEAPLRYLANRAKTLIVSVDYRRAPEFPFPTPLQDAWEALHWTIHHAKSWGGDASRLAIGGDSAGGNLAAALALQCRDNKLAPLALQLLLYPCLNLECDTPSRLEFAEGYFLTQEALNWFMRQYLPKPQDRLNPLAAPLLAKDLSQLAPAFILTAGFDPLRDDGSEYANRLVAAGVPVQYQCYPSMIHGFISMGAFTPEAHRALDQCARVLQKAFASP